MANQEHLDLLMQGTFVWNVWRLANLPIAPNLYKADLRGARLKGARLRETDLREADLSGAGLSYADLREANLSYANLSYADLSYANLRHAQTHQTIFNNLDLRRVKRLETVHHTGPSGITTSTLERSQGDIPEIFLRGAGLSDPFITYARSLTNTPTQSHICFLSYSSQDQDFTERLYTDLQSKGVRCWFAPKKSKAGDYYR